MKKDRLGQKAPTEKAIDRAVASSTAIETGESIAEIERKLKKAKKRSVSLARD